VIRVQSRTWPGVVATRSGDDTRASTTAHTAWPQSKAVTSARHSPARWHMPRSRTATPTDRRQGPPDPTTTTQRSAHPPTGNLPLLHHLLGPGRERSADLRREVEEAAVARELLQTLVHQTARAMDVATLVG
jgi:hypothetical protein